MVSVAVSLPAVMLTGLVDPKLKMGGTTAPDGPDAIAAVITMEPVKPVAGVRVMVEVLPVEDPAETVTAVPVTVKLGGTVTAGAGVRVMLVM
jgi:hypothetical protein